MEVVVVEAAVEDIWDHWSLDNISVRWEEVEAVVVVVTDI